MEMKWSKIGENIIQLKTIMSFCIFFFLSLLLSPSHLLTDLFAVRTLITNRHNVADLQAVHFKH